MERNFEYYESIARLYDQQMESVPGSGWVRGAFRELVLTTVPRGSLLLDFGCGTGLDAIWFASQGYRIVAYDQSPAMIAQVEQKKRVNGEPDIVTRSGTLEELDCTFQSIGEVDGAYSNFAVFNLIREPRFTFSWLARHIRPGGPLVISILNPLFWKDYRRAQSWRDLTTSIGMGAILKAGPEATHYRHWVHTMRRAARPEFVLEKRASVGALIRRWQGPRTWGHPATRAEVIEARSWLQFPVNRLGEFLFLVFRRCS